MHRCHQDYSQYIEYTRAPQLRHHLSVQQHQQMMVLGMALVICSCLR
ncbi:unnamed protein product [Gongylonema pulchrum]|uniref:Uncharacterized protein n=1 Tax=Gongylonema pulchrum TaxID=637853 RepID=A0A183EYZ3_9BILA|nr:unnamed protein product [Gongylonema pulchrum]